MLRCHTVLHRVCTDWCCCEVSTWDLAAELERVYAELATLRQGVTASESLEVTPASPLLRPI